MGLCPVHVGREESACPVCTIQELAAFKATLGAHLQEYRVALGEAMKEQEALELLLAQAASLLDSVSALSDVARSFILTDPSYTKLAAWVKENKT
jgi:hypothetical protein